MNIVFLDAASVGDADLSELRTLGNFTSYELTTPAQVVERSQNADVLITNKVKLMQAELLALPGLKMICIAATGMNNVDLEEADRRGIVVKNVANYSTQSVAQVTLALTLELMHRLSRYDNYVKSGAYSNSPLFTNHSVPFSEIAGKKWGIIGMGTIGKQVAGIAQAFGAEVQYYSTSGKNTNAGFRSCSLGQLVEESDIVSIHAPLNAATQGLFDLSILRRMKPGSLLVNVGRGGIVVEEDLAQALREGRPAGAGIDVFETEPLPPNNPLLATDLADRLVLTPHIAWASREARQRLIGMIAANIRSL